MSENNQSIDWQEADRLLSNQEQLNIHILKWYYLWLILCSDFNRNFMNDLWLSFIDFNSLNNWLPESFTYIHQQTNSDLDNLHKLQTFLMLRFNNEYGVETSNTLNSWHALILNLADVERLNEREWLSILLMQNDWSKYIPDKILADKLNQINDRFINRQIKLKNEFNFIEYSENNLMNNNLLELYKKYSIEKKVFEIILLNLLTKLFYEVLGEVDLHGLVEIYKGALKSSKKRQTGILHFSIYPSMWNSMIFYRTYILKEGDKLNENKL